MIKKYIRLFKRFIVISFNQVYVFRFEFAMLLVHLLFNFSFIFIFWYTLLSIIPIFNGWQFSELALYTSIIFLGEGLGGIFFGFRDLPSKIIEGQLDKYLCRPINTLIAVLFEQVSIIYFLEQIIMSILLIILILLKYKISVSFLSILISLTVLVIGVLITNFIYGILTFLCFWVGRLEVVRELIMQLTGFKQYPLTIFPQKIQLLLTYVIPVAFVSYYPTVFLLEKQEMTLVFVFKLLIYLVIVFSVFVSVWRYGIKRYESNGG